MAGKTYLGIDAGTSVVKAAIFDQDGNALAVKGRWTLIHGGAGSAARSSRTSTSSWPRSSGRPGRHPRGRAAPGSVALTGQGDGCWIYDENFHPVRPALSWLDGRAGSLVDQWSKYGVSEQVFRISGGTMFPGAPGAA